MADAYGTINFAKSHDCIFDAQKMKNLLNTFIWDTSGGRWVCDNELYFVGSERRNLTQYPNAIPIKVTSYTVATESGNEIQKLPSEMTQHDLDNHIDAEEDEVPLSELSEAISPLLESGWIEIFCEANEKERYFYSESVRVYADGKVHSSYSESGPFAKSIVRYEEYPPISTEG